MFRSSRTPPAPWGGRTRRRPRLTLQTLEDRTAPAAGPRVIGGNPPPGDKPFAGLSQFTVIFDQTMDPATFTAADVVSFTGPNGPVTVTNVAPTQFGGNQTFAISFDPQGTASTYSYSIGPDIRDTSARLMDQNNITDAGEDPGDRFTGTFQLYGPRISGRNPVLAADGTINQVLVGFQPSTPGINGSTFTPEDVVLSGPNGPITVTSVTPSPIRPTFEFFVNFAPQATAGVYSFSVGPNIADTFGNLLDQNQDGIGGTSPGDVFSSPFTLAPFRLSFMVPNGSVISGSASSIRVTFSRSVNPATLGPDDVVSFTVPGGVSIPVMSITPVAGSTTQFDLGFAQQSAIGVYTLVMGPNIFDTLGNGMDNDSDFTPGEVPADRFTGTFSILGPRIDSGPGGGLNVSSTTVFFSQPMDPATFTVYDITLTGPSGAIPVTSVTANSGNQSFTVVFPPQTQFGQYNWVVGPDIRNTFGIALDQNQNFIPGETPGDQTFRSFNVTAPRIISSSPANNVVALGPISKVTFTFDRDMNPATFTTADVVSFTDPAGAAIPVTGVNAVTARVFDVTFAAQNTDGRYTVVVGPDIRDTFGNPMNQDNDQIAGEDPGDRFTLNFTLNVFGPDAFGYTARPTAWENFNLEPGQPGVFTILDNVDDAAAAVNLAANTFNFYGLVYTGNNNLYVNTNGMITFGSPSNQPNSPFQKPSPTQPLSGQPYIAAFYRDWTTADSPQPTGAVLGKFDDTNGDGQPDRLIVEW